MYTLHTINTCYTYIYGFHSVCIYITHNSVHCTCISISINILVCWLNMGFHTSSASLKPSSSAEHSDGFISTYIDIQIVYVLQ